MSFSEDDCADMADMKPTGGKDRTSSLSSVSTTASCATFGPCTSIRENEVEDDCGAVQPMMSRRSSLLEVGRRNSLGWGRRNSLVSLGAPPSDVRYAEPAQTMIILDFDDTLFPTTEVFDRWGVSKLGDDTVPPEKEEAMEAWRDALFNYLTEATCLSDRCVIITNSKKTWVENCVRRFAPNLAKFFGEGPGDQRRVKVVYSVERLNQSKKLRHKQTDLRPVMRRQKTREELEDEQTRAKYTAMRKEVAAFYSQYPGQSWKNVISEGDMRYEHDAVTELGYRRNPKSPEKLRTKAIIVPTGPSITEITLRLQVGRLLLPAYVHVDGDLDLDLRSAVDPLAAIAEALRLPALKDVPLSRHAWGREPPPEDLEELEEALDEVAVVVHGSLFG